MHEYDIQDAKDVQGALKDLLGETIKELMEAEMNHHLGWKSERTDSTDEVRDYRNGYKTKQVNSSFDSMDIEVPQERLSEFEAQKVKKRQKDVSDIDRKIISMYAKGLSDYSRAAKPPVRCGESHLSGLTEPPSLSIF